MTLVVTFDLDDTLYPEHAFARSGFRAVDRWLRERGVVEGFFERAQRLFDRGERGTVFDRALEELGVTPSAELIRDLVAVYRSHQPELELHPDAEPCLRACRARRGVRLAMITDGYLETQRRKVRALGLERWFDPIVYSDALGRDQWKPSPAPFRAVMAAVAESGARFVYVADNPGKDFVTARRLGWHTVQVRRADGEYANLEVTPEFRAHHVVDSLNELQALLDDAGRREGPREGQGRSGGQSAAGPERGQG